MEDNRPASQLEGVPSLVDLEAFSKLNSGQVNVKIDKYEQIIIHQNYAPIEVLLCIIIALLLIQLFNYKKKKIQRKKNEL